VNTFLDAVDLTVQAVRTALFWGAAVLAVVAAIDWLVRTRRINPFGPIARFFRASVDPLIAPIERRVMRAGGTPASAPWWALGAVVVGGIALLSGLDYLRDLVRDLLVASVGGPSHVVRVLVAWTFVVLQVALIVRVIGSWVRISPYSRWIRWSYTLTEWLLRPLRQLIPPVGMIDVTPIVAYFVLSLVGKAVQSAL
jgi:YggT family protein